MATPTQIQRNWRGYYVRRYIFNYRAYKEYLRGVVLINEITRSRIKEERERVEREQAEREEKIQEVKLCAKCRMRVCGH